jgi:hypothetical protein
MGEEQKNGAVVTMLRSVARSIARTNTTQKLPTNSFKEPNFSTSTHTEKGAYIDLGHRATPRR